MERRADIIALLIAVAVVTAVVARAVNAAAPTAKRSATADDRTSLAASVAAREAEWRSKAAMDFPADHWSQRDAFHGDEAATVKELAGVAGISYEDVLRAIDEDVRKTQGRDRCADVVPVKPRPVFD